MKNNKKTFLISGVSLIVFLVSVSFIQVIRNKHIIAAEEELKNQSEYLASKSPIKRQPAQSDELLVSDLDEGSLSGNLFGSRDLRLYLLKFNRELENTYNPHFGSSSDAPLYFKNDHCHIYGYKSKKEIKIKRNRYGIFYFDYPWGSNNELQIMVSNFYIWPNNLSIIIDGVDRMTPVSEIEQICEGVFTIRRFF